MTNNKNRYFTRTCYRNKILSTSLNLKSLFAVSSGTIFTII